jgi:hypothetical protein
MLSALSALVILFRNIQEWEDFSPLCFRSDEYRESQQLLDMTVLGVLHSKWQRAYYYLFCYAV